MREDFRKTFRYVGTLLAICAVLIVVLAIVIDRTTVKMIEVAEQPEDAEYVIEGVTGMKIGGPFTLQKQDGSVVTDQTYAGQYRLMFFGFTYCPDICPAELGTLSRVLDQLTPAQKEKIKVIFISTDPERDTVEQMNQYMSLFHPDIDGLTGSREQINAVLSAYKIYAQRVQTPEMTDYTMDHTANMYLFDKENNVTAIFKSGVSDRAILKVLNKTL